LHIYRYLYASLPSCAELQKRDRRQKLDEAGGQKVEGAQKFLQMRFGTVWSMPPTSPARELTCPSLCPEAITDGGDPRGMAAVRHAGTMVLRPFCTNLAVHRGNDSAGRAEFHFQGSWYMISISYVDVPALASSEELEMMADEFLRQQNGRHRRQFS
jgi:hypothetical protein